MKFKLIGAFAALISLAALAGCSTAGSSTLYSSLGNGSVMSTIPPKGVAQDPGTIATTITSASGASVDVFVVDVNRKQKLLIPIVSKPGFFKPSIVAAGFTICNKDPNCPQISNVIGGVGEPTGNVLIGGVANVLGAYFGRSGGDSFNLSATGGTGYGGTGGTSYGSTVTNTNTNDNQNENDVHVKVKSVNVAGSGSSSGSGGGSGSGKPPKKPCKPKNSGIHTDGQTSGGGSSGGGCTS